MPNAVVITAHAKQRWRRPCIARGFAMLYIVLVNIILLYLVYNRPGKFSAETLTKTSIARFLMHAPSASHSTASSATTLSTNKAHADAANLAHSADHADHVAAACSISASVVFAVVPTVPSTSTAQTSKFAPPYDHYVRLLQQILKLSRSLQPTDIHLQIFLDVETLHPAHRQWCRDIPWCHLRLLSNASDYVDVIQSMHDLRLCAPHYVILPDTASIDSAFMLRLNMLPVARVACLTSPATNSLADLCPGRAFLIPEPDQFRRQRGIVAPD